MMNMRTLLCLLPCTIVLIPCRVIFAQVELTANHSPTLGEESFPEEYLAVHALRTHTEMKHLARRWKETLSSLEQCWLFRLLFSEKIVSQAPLKTEPNFRLNRHDVSLEGGRYAWLFEQLSGRRLPPMTSMSSHDDLMLARRIIEEEATTHWIQHQVETKHTLFNAMPQDLASQMSLAVSMTTREEALEALAEYSDVTVRRGVARNPNTSGRALSVLEDDRDPEVRRAARINAQRARTRLGRSEADNGTIEEILARYPHRTLPLHELCWTSPLELPGAKISHEDEARALAWNAYVEQMQEKPGPYETTGSVALATLEEGGPVWVVSITDLQMNEYKNWAFSVRALFLVHAKTAEVSAITGMWEHGASTVCAADAKGWKAEKERIRQERFPSIVADMPALLPDKAEQLSKEFVFSAGSRHQKRADQLSVEIHEITLGCDIPNFAIRGEIIIETRTYAMNDGSKTLQSILWFHPYTADMHVIIKPTK